MGNHDPKAWEQGDERGRAQSQMVFASIHHHTTFSYKDGYGTPDQHAARGRELGLRKIFVTEHGNVSSHVAMEQAGAKHDIDVGFGIELYTGNVGEHATQRKNHLTVLAENAIGYQNLLRVTSRAWAEGFYYEPTASGAMLREHAEGLIVASGCSGSLLATTLVGGKNVAPEDASYDEAKKVAANFKRTFPGSYYIEVQAFPELETTRNINVGLAQIAEELNLPLVATLDVHYTTPDESEMQQILHNVRGGAKKSMEDQAKAWSYDVKLCPITDQQIFRRLVATGLTRKQAEQAIRNSNEIADRCNVTLPKVENLRYPLPEGMDDPVVLFRKWINEGWHYRGFDRLVGQERDTYIKQAKYEMKLIEEKGFVDYFLVVSDAVRFAKDSGIPVGPARGSAAASLVCYLLRITEVNPIPFPTLLFERFIDLNRHDLPDIDLDFDDERRHEVRDYLVSKYGSDRVGNIGTFTKYKGKNSIDDVCRVFNIPEAIGAELKGLLIERSSGDLRAASTIADSVEMFDRAREITEQYPDILKATLLEGNTRDMSVHAAGLVIANAPLSDFCAVYTRIDKDTGEITQVVSLDKHDAEYLNVMKLDALGLKTMAAIRIALEQIGMTLDELYAIPLDDEETIKGFKEGDVVGIFQFDGRAMRSVNTGVVPDNFMEICDINALARPGPLHSGATAEYIDIKHGRAEATHYHPVIDDITKHTQFQIVYQEQILQVVRLLGNFSWEEASRIRKIISKKRGEQEFNTMRAKFIEGAANHDLDAGDADRVFSLLATAGAYAFNAAHCVSYGMLAYWTMWLKRNHPQAFYVGAFRKCGSDKKGKVRLRQLLQDARKHGVEILKLNMNRSDITWTAEGDAIRPGFMQITGVGEKMAQRLVQARDEMDGFAGWDDVGTIHGVGPKKIELFQSFIEDEDPFELDLLSNTIAKVKQQLFNGDLADDAGLLPSPTHRSIDVPYDRTPENVAVTWLGVIRERNLKELFELHHSRTGEILDPATVKEPGKNEWVVMLGEDETEPIIITVDRWRYRRFKKSVWSINLDRDLVLVKGFKYGVQSRRAIYVTDLWVLGV
jgi:DNA polymerase-3 subunit alpha